MPQSFVRVPPQSTGKRVASTERYQLQYDTQTNPFSVGTVVTGASSGASGTITSIDQEGYVPTEGVLWLKDVTGTFVNNENIEVSAVTHAVSNITGSYPFQSYEYQNIVIADPENPTNLQRVDRFGATLNTFTDGSPVFGPFGTLAIGQPQLIKGYRFAFDGSDDDWYSRTVGTGSVTYVPNQTAILLSTGTASGDVASRTTHYYHPYSPGSGQLIEMTVRVGDSGKQNVRRRWGYFDDDNGVFFELDDTSLYVVVRSNVTGSVVDTRVAQSEWNVDSLDGSDNIGFTLDPSAPNVYWIDMQWLGAGRVRFGVLEPRGSRLTAHVVEHANTSSVSFPYMQTATLPLRIEQVNTAIASSTSEMSFVCAAVKHESQADPVGVKRAVESPYVAITDSDGEVPILSYRPATTFVGKSNHGIIKGISISFANIESGVSNAPVIFRVRAGTDVALTGESFTLLDSASFMEVDTAATSISAAAPNILSFIVAPNNVLNIQDIAERRLHTFELFLRADNVTQPTLTLTAQSLSGSANVMGTVNVEEIRQ